MDEIWSTDSADMIDYETSKKTRFFIHYYWTFLKKTWCTAMKNRNAQTKQFSFHTFQLIPNENLIISKVILEMRFIIPIFKTSWSLKENLNNRGTLIEDHL